MDIQKIATYGTAATVISTGAFVGGNTIIDQQSGGPAKRALEKWVWGAGAVLTAFIVIGGIVGDLNIIPDREEVSNVSS